MSQLAPRHFAVRRVNPFEGVLQVVEIPLARAYSPNGEVWQIQVLAQRPDHTWRSGGQREPVQQYFNFGLWDALDGLRRVPANPVMDIAAMMAAAEALIEQLRLLLDNLPFPLIDDYEYWATDVHGNPLALLASTDSPSMLHEAGSLHWLATRRVQHDFISPSLLRRGIAAHNELGPRQHAEQLERTVRGLAQGRTWFHRRGDRSGQAVAPAASTDPLPSAHFPLFGLKDDWDDPVTRELVDDYLQWQAPRLLLLQHLSDAHRERLEITAARQAVELAALYRLLPKMIDRARIESARVEARLRQAAR